VVSINCTDDNNSIYKLISRYSATNTCPMHMPGHKRNNRLLSDDLPYNIDISEISGFDDLHDPQGIIKQTSEIANTLYGSNKTFLLVNGSSCGILAGIRAAVKRGGKIIMDRNCHRSVYHAAELNGLQTVYLLPETDQQTGISGSISPLQVEQELANNPDAKLIVITSPTYEGVISDISKITAAAHQRDVTVLIDAAHGAHLGFSDYFPVNANNSGADLVVQSLHKTLPALTQCALAHINGSLIDPNKMAKELAIFETSSPSYVLLASIDSCLRLLKNNKDGLFKDIKNNIGCFDNAIKEVENIHIVCHGSDHLYNHPHFFGYDPGKIVISTRGTNLTGIKLAQIMRGQYKIELEMAAADYAIAITSICDSKENFERLADALNRIDQTVIPKYPIPNYKNTLPRQVMSISDALELNSIAVPLTDAIGMVALEYVWAYPPGIPLIVPGEIIDENIIEQINIFVSTGIMLKSTDGEISRQIAAISV